MKDLFKTNNNLEASIKLRFNIILLIYKVYKTILNDNAITSIYVRLVVFSLLFYELIDVTPYH